MHRRACLLAARRPEQHGASGLARAVVARGHAGSRPARPTAESRSALRVPDRRRALRLCRAGGTHRPAAVRHGGGGAVALGVASGVRLDGRSPFVGVDSPTVHSRIPLRDRLQRRLRPRRRAFHRLGRATRDVPRRSCAPAASHCRPSVRPLVGAAPATLEGWVAVSVTNLTALQRDELSWLRAYCPVDSIGGSILLYYFDSTTRRMRPARRPRRPVPRRRRESPSLNNDTAHARLPRCAR